MAQRLQATPNEGHQVSQEPQTDETSLEDIEAEKQKFLKEKEAWENEKKRLQEQLRRERQAREIEREKEKMKQERREWELERARMQQELDATSRADSHDDEALAHEVGDDDDEGIDDPNEMSEAEQQFRAELAEKLPELTEGWEEMDADQKWEAIKGLGLFEDAFMEEVEGAQKEIADKNLEPEAEKAERNELMDSLLQELDELAFPPDPMDQYREEWDRLLEETTEPHKRETMYKAWEQCEDDQKYNMLLEWSSYLRRPENPYYAMTQGLDTSNTNNNSSSSSYDDIDFGAVKGKDSTSEALKYGLLFFVMLIVVFILFLVLFPEMWRSITDTFSDEI